MIDSFGRTIDYLRISVTDRCNERCVYCMPNEGIKALCHKDILSYEEIALIAKVFAKQGIKTIRLTGGDPLVRKNISDLVKMLKATEGIQKVYLTTNGLELKSQLNDLLLAGIDGINLSLDSLSDDIYAKITRRSKTAEDVKNILECIEILCNIKKNNPDFSVKINCVLSGLNNDQLIPIAKLAKTRNISVRFIELMPIGMGKTLEKNFLGQDKVLSLFENEFGKMIPCEGNRYNYFRPNDFIGTIGFISPVTHKFCSTCNRLRITADGFLKACLQFDKGIALKPMLTEEINENTQNNLVNALFSVINSKPKQNTFYETNESSVLINEPRLMSQIGG